MQQFTNPFFHACVLAYPGTWQLSIQTALLHTHELLSKDISIDSFGLMLNEMQENLSIVSFSSRLASQVWKIFFLLLIILGISRVVWINSYLCSIFFFHEFATIVFMHYIWIFMIRLLKFPCCGIYYKKKYFLSPHYFPLPEFDQTLQIIMY